MQSFSVLYGNDDDYTYHFKDQISQDQIEPILRGLEWVIKPSVFPDYLSEIYVIGSHNIDDVLTRLRKEGLDPVPETIAEEPWVYKPEEESYEEYRKRCGL